MTEPRLLYPGDAVAALILFENRYLLQRRDCKEGIFFPGFLGNFGGAIEVGENPEEALVRELHEELGIEITEYSFFCRLLLDFRYGNAGEVLRHFFIVRLTSRQIAQIVVGEGTGYELHGGDELLAMPSVVPYDSLAIWQHMTQHLIGGRYFASD
jgi:8-oxo-dGTP pyrophosphatase MutT (NUDIX family)